MFFIGRYFGRRTTEKTNGTDPSTINNVLNDRILKHTPDISLSMSKTDFDTIHPNTRLVTVHIVTNRPSKFVKFLQMFHCIAKRTLDDSKKFSRNNSNVIVDYAKRTKDNASITNSDISNSSLKDIENGALEDELAAYMYEMYG